MGELPTAVGRPGQPTTQSPVGAGYPPLAEGTLGLVVVATVAIAAQRLQDRGLALSSADADELAARTTGLFRAAEVLHAYPLANADEPAFALSGQDTGR